MADQKKAGSAGSQGKKQGQKPSSGSAKPGSSKPGSAKPGPAKSGKK